MLDRNEARSEGALSRLVRKVQERTAQGEAISIGLLQEVAGVQAAAPILLIPALIVVSPLSIIPGLPTVIGLHTVIVSAQIIAGRRQIWLPGWLTRRSLSARHADKLLGFLLPVTRLTDGMVRRRWLVLTQQPMRRLGAGVCLLLGAVMPLLEFIPMSSTIAASIIAVFALGLMARDGLLTAAWWGALAIVVALGLWLAPQAIEFVTGTDLPTLVPELEGTPLEVLDPLLPD